MILVYITCKNKKEAKKIAIFLIKKRLAACCNIFPIESIYRWPTSASASAKASADKKATAGKQNKIVQDKEAVLILKTLKKNFQKIEKEIKKLHSYKIPCILEIPVTQGSRDFIKWLEKEIE